MSGTQDEQHELCSIWERLKAGTEHDEHFQLELGDGLSARIQFDMDLGQVLSFEGVAPYRDSSKEGAGTHKRRPRSVETDSWGMWEDYRIA